MSIEEGAVAAKPLATPYQLDLTQTTQACTVLLKHIADERQRREAENTKPNLLADDDGSAEGDAEEDTDDTPVWMILTTKKHIVDQKRLKPSKIPIPHSTNPKTSTVCLITADPSSDFTTALDSPAFPAALRARITRIISLSKIKSSFQSYEARRKLLPEHDLFLADDRIITYLPQVLGKTFYKGGSKRPVPVSISPVRPRDDDGKRLKVDAVSAQRKRDGKDTAENSKGAATPQQIAKEIERALSSALVHLAPGVSTAVKVGTASMTPEMISANIEALMTGLTEKFVTNGWRNVRAVHIKGPNSVAFPVWLASELWVDEADVKEQKPTFGKKKDETKAIEAPAAEPNATKSRKRKADGKPAAAVEAVSGDAVAAKHAKKKRKAEADDKSAKEAAERKEKRKKQKAEALADVE